MTLSIQQVVDPSPAEVPQEITEFLRWLGGPTVITLTGQDTCRSRMAVTLLHGNEPSGAKAVLRLIREQFKPAVTCHFLIASVDLALTEPVLSQRHLPDHRDLNRCFAGPYDDPPGQLAEAILSAIDRLRPEALVDLHNTSGNGPAFSLTTHLSRDYCMLSAFFTHRVIVTDLRMGTLMEISSPSMPVVTIECGGAGGLAADHYAYLGLKKFCRSDALFYEHSQLEDLDVYLHPVRLEASADSTITYGEFESGTAAEILMTADIERHNFGVVDPDTPLARVSGNGGLRLKSGSGYHGLDGYFEIRGNYLYPACKLKLFMATTNPVIAKSDCLLYAVKEVDHAHFLTH